MTYRFINYKNAISLAAIALVLNISDAQDHANHGPTNKRFYTVGDMLNNGFKNVFASNDTRIEPKENTESLEKKIAANIQPRANEPRASEPITDAPRANIPKSKEYRPTQKQAPVELPIKKIEEEHHGPSLVSRVYDATALNISRAYHSITDYIVTIGKSTGERPQAKSNKTAQTQKIIQTPSSMIAKSHIPTRIRTFPSIDQSISTYVLQNVNPLNDYDLTRRMKESIRYINEAYGKLPAPRFMPKDFILALTRSESPFDDYARGPVDGLDQGRMQVRPSAWQAGVDYLVAHGMKEAANWRHGKHSFMARPNMLVGTAYQFSLAEQLQKKPSFVHSSQGDKLRKCIVAYKKGLGELEDADWELRNISKEAKDQIILVENYLAPHNQYAKK